MVLGWWWWQTLLSIHHTYTAPGLVQEVRSLRSLFILLLSSVLYVSLSIFWQVLGLHEVCVEQAGLGGWTWSCCHATGRCCCSLAAGGPCVDITSEPAAGIHHGVHWCGHHIPRLNYSLRLVDFHLFKTYLSILSSFHTFCFDPQWPIPLVCVCCLFPGPWCCTAEPAVWYDRVTWPCLQQLCFASLCGGQACWVQGWLASCSLPGSSTGGFVE